MKLLENYQTFIAKQRRKPKRSIGRFIFDLSIIAVALLTIYLVAVFVILQGVPLVLETILSNAVNTTPQGDFATLLIMVVGPLLTAVLLISVLTAVIIRGIWRWMIRVVTRPVVAMAIPAVVEDTVVEDDNDNDEITVSQLKAEMDIEEVRS